MFSKGFTEKWSREIFNIDCVLKTKPRTYKIKYVNIEKIMESFYVKELLLNQL